MKKLLRVVEVLILLCAVFIISRGWLGIKTYEPEDIDTMDRKEIFFQQAEKMGLFAASKYEITPKAVFVWSNPNVIVYSGGFPKGARIQFDSTTTMSVYGRPVHLGTLQPGESSSIEIGWVVGDTKIVNTKNNSNSIKYVRIKEVLGNTALLLDCKELGWIQPRYAVDIYVSYGDLDKWYHLIGPNLENLPTVVVIDHDKTKEN